MTSTAENRSIQEERNSPELNSAMISIDTNDSVLAVVSFSDALCGKSGFVEEVKNMNDVHVLKNESIIVSCLKEDSVQGEKSEGNGSIISTSVKAESEMSADSTSEMTTDSYAGEGLRAAQSPPFRESTSPSTTHNYSLSLTNEDSNTSEDSNLVDLPQEIIEEERRFAQQSKSEMTENRVASLSDDERERRYKTLMTLLGKSKEYARYISRKLISSRELSKETTEEKPQASKSASNCPRSSRKRKNSSRGDDVTPSKKSKAEPDDEKVAYDPRTHYKNAMNLVVSRRQPRLLVGGIMRDYQLDGLEWMTALYTNGVNGILADEMGLGKTIQVISLLCHLREKRVYGPHLIIGPLSTLPNWLAEFANFAPDVPVALFHGPEEKREKIIEQYVALLAKKDRPNLPIIITSYEMPLRDKKFLSAINWRSITVDEGHRLKNYQTMLAKELRSYRSEYRLLLTGTPLQNNLTELWSLLNYLIPEIFDDLEQFENLFDFSDLRTTQQQKELIQKEKEEQLVSRMHQILEPFLLRRVKADVQISLPKKKEIIVKAPMTVEQQKLYKSVMDKSIIENSNAETANETITSPENGKRIRRRCTLNKSYSENWNIDKNKDYMPIQCALPCSLVKERIRSPTHDVEYIFNIKLTRPFMMLRKIANHPYLVKTPVYPNTRDIVVDENLIQQSGKLLVLDALLPRLKEGGHKILLFSAFKILLDLIEDYVIMRGYKYLRLDGATDIQSRLEYIKQFNTDANTFIFLITTRAGGLGINLTAADTVIIYDSDWNPQVDLQAQDRCHRIGQTRPVVVYRLLAAGTVDEYMINTAVNKRRLEKLVVKKGKFVPNANETGLDLTELKELMESTDYEQIIYPNGLVLSDEEIERLLDRSNMMN